MHDVSKEADYSMLAYEADSNCRHRRRSSVARQLLRPRLGVHDLQALGAVQLHILAVYHELTLVIDRGS